MTTMMLDEKIDQQRRLAELDRREEQIRKARKRLLETDLEISQELLAIQAEKLYQARGYKELTTWAWRELDIAPEELRQYLIMGRVSEQLHTRGLILPLNKNQFLVLGKIPEGKLVPFWERFLREHENRIITAKAIEEQIEKSKAGLGTQQEQDGVNLVGSYRIRLEVKDDLVIVEASNETEACMRYLAEVTREELLQHLRVKAMKM